MLFLFFPSRSSLFSLSLSLLVTLWEQMHLIMQRPSCRISKVIDVIRLLTSASSHAQNIKKGLTHKWAAYCCAGLVITLLRASVSECVSVWCFVTYVSNICCCGTKYTGQGVRKCQLLLEMLYLVCLNSSTFCYSHISALDHWICQIFTLYLAI